MKTYVCKVLSQNKKTGGFMVQAKNDKGQTVTRHLDANMKGRNPNDDAPKLHAKMKAAVEDKQWQIQTVEGNIARFREASKKAEKEGKALPAMTIMDEAAASLADLLVRDLKADLKGLTTQYGQLLDEMPLTAQFYEAQVMPSLME